MSKPTVAQLLAAMDDVAPLQGAADWDNVGLLAGKPDWPARRVMLAIDLTDAVAEEALAAEVDALLLYHPPIFKGIQQITPDAATPTKLFPDLLAARISLLAVHTALDVAVGGTNDVLLDVFEPTERRPVRPAEKTGQEYKLVVFVPPDEAAALRTALSGAGAGVIGNYSECSYELHGSGTFKGNEASNPAVGEKLQLERVDEARIEMVVSRGLLAAVIRTLYAQHSYEEPAFDLYPLHKVSGRGAAGLGRVGTLAQPTCGPDLIRKLATLCDLTSAQVVGPIDRPFERVVTAAGAFGVGEFRDPDAFVVTGEFKHHDALQLLKRGVTAIHVGHDATERPALSVLAERLGAQLTDCEFNIATKDVSPFQSVANIGGL